MPLESRRGGRWRVYAGHSGRTTSGSMGTDARGLGFFSGKQMLNPDYKEMLECLSQEGVSFLLVGAYTLAVYSYPQQPKTSTSSYGLHRRTRRA